jgi:hypothetical protein
MLLAEVADASRLSTDVQGKKPGVIGKGARSKLKVGKALLDQPPTKIPGGDCEAF